MKPYARKGGKRGGAMRQAGEDVLSKTGRLRTNEKTGGPTSTTFYRKPQGK